MSGRSALPGLAKRALSLSLKLSRTSSELPRVGYVRNQWGTYWKEELIYEQIALYESAIRTAPNIDEAAAAAYSLGNVYFSILQWQKAAENFQSMMCKFAERSAPCRHMLARISARQGDLETARNYARLLDQDPSVGAFRIPESELIREFEAGDEDRRFSMFEKVKED